MKRPRKINAAFVNTFIDKRGTVPYHGYIAFAYLQIYPALPAPYETEPEYEHPHH